MAGRVRAWLGGGPARDGRNLRWLAFGGYAQRVFGGASPAWFSEPGRHVKGLADANKVLGSAVVEFDLGELWVAHRELAAGATGVERVRTLGGDAGLRAFCRDAIGALVHGQGAKADIFLALPSPATLLMALGEDASAIDFDLLDDVATLLVGMMREHADAGVDGLVLTVSDSGVDAGDELEASETIKNAAAHYGWVFAVRAASAALAGNYRALNPDLWLGFGPPADLHAVGAGLDAEFWRDGALATPEASACLYGEVPVELDPRLIVQRVAALPR